MDRSNGYEAAAQTFMEYRGNHAVGTGVLSVHRWVQTLPAGAVVLDLGCGTGLPVTRVLVESGMVVYGIDASPTLVKAFEQNFPDARVACESVETSSFFDRKFDAVIAVGLLFILPIVAQEAVIRCVGIALNNGGRFLFTAPTQKAEWVDVLTGKVSASPGEETYRAWLGDAGLSVLEEFDDEGGNHYYAAAKM